jgi:hypothetical protein
MDVAGSRLAAQMLTAALRTTCRQLKPYGPAVPLKALSKVGQVGFVAPTTAAADLARMAGR